MPEYRNKGIGKQVANLIIASGETHGLDFSLFIIETNTPAIAFWNDVFESNGYQERLLIGNILALDADKRDIRFSYWAKAE